MADTSTKLGASVQSQARVATLPNKARTYMIQMCKHFGHKVEASFDDIRGRIALGDRVCEMEVTQPQLLTINLTADSDASLQEIEDVVDRHLRRFAFKEELQIQWVRSV